MSTVVANEGGVEPLMSETAWGADDFGGGDRFEALAALVARGVRNHQTDLVDGPCWRPMTDAMREGFSGPVPVDGQDPEAVIAEVVERILPYGLGNGHPRHWGWVNGSGLPVGALGDFLAAGLNANCALFDQAPAMVELQTLAWLKDALGYPSTGSGILVSGGSIANLIGLTAARQAKSGVDIRRVGVAGGPTLRVYVSSETHSSVQRAVETLGIGADNLVRIPTDGRFRMDAAALAKAIRQDRANGFRPMAIAASAGTVNTGAIDPLDDIADIAAEEDVWVHVDGAFGAVAWLDPRQHQALKGLQRADSLSFDLHKWLYLPYGVGCVLMRDAKIHREAFAVAPAYLSNIPGSLSDAPIAFGDYGLELSRPLRALKVWMALKTYGLNAYRRAVAANIDQAAWLARRVEQDPCLELLAPAELNVVCFRYRPREPTANDSLDAVNRDILVSLQRSGVAAPSGTIINGAFALRVAIANHRTALEDLEILASRTVSLGQKLLASPS